MTFPYEPQAVRIARARLILMLALFLPCGVGDGGVAAQEAEAPAADAASANQGQEEAPLKRIKMTAENWKWSPDQIRVALGTRVRIEFQSYDASHSFVLKAYKINVPLPEGKTGEVEFVADKAGEFRWRCGRPCGNGCAKMTGKLIVE
jgi:heme/copper-type cytochrome/quinol oxidase subunit 2